MEEHFILKVKLWKNKWKNDDTKLLT